jgi:hypothetical protein
MENIVDSFENGTIKNIPKYGGILWGFMDYLSSTK